MLLLIRFSFDVVLLDFISAAYEIKAIKMSLFSSMCFVYYIIKISGGIMKFVEPNFFINFKRQNVFCDP